MNTSQSVTYAQTSVSSIFMRQVYQWMTAGLGATALVAWFVASTPAPDCKWFFLTVVADCSVWHNWVWLLPFLLPCIKCRQAWRQAYLYCILHLRV